MAQQNRDQAVAEYRGLVEGLARKVANSRRARNVGAEYDDLVQEGMIAVWQALGKGDDPARVIENRMKDWIRYLGRQVPADYDSFLPMEESTGAQ